MLVFSVSLSSNQLKVLAHIKRHIEICGSFDAKKNPTNDQMRAVGLGPSFFIAGVDKLKREGLVEFLDPGWRITEKGETVLKLAKMEAEKFIADISPAKMKVAK